MRYIHIWHDKTLEPELWIDCMGKRGLSNARSYKLIMLKLQMVILVYMYLVVILVIIFINDYSIRYGGNVMRGLVNHEKTKSASHNI